MLVAVITDIAALNKTGQMNCQVCPVPYVYLPISTGSTDYDPKALVTIVLVSIQSFYLLQSPARTSSESAPSYLIIFQIFGCMASVSSSLLIILRM